MPDLRVHLRVLAPLPQAVECAAPGCHMPLSGSDELGFCGACERVYRAVMALCDRLLERDVARLEHETPGITAAAHAALISGPACSAARVQGRAGGRATPPPARVPWEPLLPLPVDLDGLQDLVSELYAEIDKVRKN